MSDIPLTENILDGLSTAVLMLDIAHNIRFANSASEALCELSKNQLIGQSIQQLLFNSTINLQRLTSVVEHPDSYTEGDIQIIFSTGKHCTVDVTVNPLQHGDNFFILMEFSALDKKRKITLDNQHWAHQRAAKELIRGIAHEVKNPLGGIRGAAQLLERELANNEQKEYTRLIVEQSDRLRTLVDEMLGPNALPKFQVQSVHRILEKIRTLIVLECGDKITVQRDYDPSIPDILLDEDMLQQAVLNIARNAVQAIEGYTQSGHIIFITRIQRQQTIQGKKYPLCIEMKIVDNGSGIAPEIKDTLFYPMVSTKNNGSGLGLSIAQSLVEHHQGKIEVESWPGHTAISILLPINRKDTRS